MARKKGLFRASKYNYQAKLLKEIINDILGKIETTEYEEGYFKNVSTLLTVSSEISHIKEKISSTIRSRPYFLKTVLILAETKFFDLANYPHEESESADNLIYFDDKEAITSSISYIIHIYNELRKKEKLNAFNMMDENIDDVFYFSLFYDAFKMQKYDEAEINVDFFDYKVSYDSQKKHILIENPDFELAKSYGYAKTELRFMSQINELYESNTNIMHIGTFLDKDWQFFSKKDNDFIYEIIKKPQERIVIKSHLLPPEHKFNLFSSNKLFIEEVAMLKSLTDENYNNNLIQVKIYKNFTVLDILKFQRYFNYINFIYNKVYEKLNLQENPLAMTIRKRSVLPLFKLSDLISIIQSLCSHTNEDCSDLIIELTTDLSKNNDFIDLQYKPILKINNSYYVLPTILSKSNLVRSLSLNINRHLSIIEKNDYMIESFTNALSKQEFNVFTELKFSNIEADIIAFRDNNLFFFECKNPYHPVNSFELRNTFSHIEKGISQMIRFRELSYELKYKKLLDRLKIDISNIKNTFYGVINANRLLSGYSYKGIKVFHANEIINFINTGSVFSGDSYYHCWENDIFHSNDLISYMNGDVLTEDIINEKIEIIYEIKTRSYTMIFKTYGFDVFKANDKISKNK
ncbi:hypothetical protein H4F46_05710 [Pectobacterium brasiliense]|uniref:hypothetical protein n=1 Tax=Pectobacterium brasiliense TaxID=180957 RepID=UPI001969129B|nr:hypothetical protein [Pectobacterium brasiliense]MBN3114396.1 hypothetical protein [Pectobacterium brasiliense]